MNRKKIVCEYLQKHAGIPFTARELSEKLFDSNVQIKKHYEETTRKDVNPREQLQAEIGSWFAESSKNENFKKLIKEYSIIREKHPKFKHFILYSISPNKNIRYKLIKHNEEIIFTETLKDIYHALIKTMSELMLSESEIESINKDFKTTKNPIICKENSLLDNNIRNKKLTKTYNGYVFYFNYSSFTIFHHISKLINKLEELNKIKKGDYSFEKVFNKINLQKMENKKMKQNYNQILFGAPGTGKSYFIKEILDNDMIEQEFIFRTTFYEEYSYFDFVGQFKPTMIYNDNNTVLYRRTPEKINNDVKRFGEPSVIYEFVSGVFINAYLKAKSNPEQNVYLIIEEINRGNAPAIFGEFFQSLDRDVEGGSKYDIKVSQELKQHIQQNLNEKELNKEHLDYNFSLPKNLFILATMNTSDQSLFKMDTAFKRRWSMKYHPISFENTIFEGLMIEDSEILWKDFIVETNKLILNVLNNEDKMIGQFFCTEFNGVISKDDFSDKLLHYLFFDVFRFNRSEVFETESFSELYKKTPEDVFELIKKALN